LDSLLPPEPCRVSDAGRRPNAPDDERGRRVLFLAGDDADATKVVADLAESWSFHPIDLGKIAAGGLLIQFGGPLTTLSLISQPIGGASMVEMDLLKP
jgi:predicted dinucleotide-binding enzyme